MEKYKNYNIETLQLWEPIHDTEVNKKLQNDLSDRVAHINTVLSQINQLPFSLRDYQITSIPQTFIHHHVEKSSYKRKNGIKKNEKKHIPTEALIDGVHVKIEIARKWFNHMNKVMKNVLQHA